MNPKRKAYNALVTEVKALQDAAKGKPMTPEVGESIDAKATEAETLWAEIEAEEKRESRTAELVKRAARVTDPTIPADDQPGAASQSEKEAVAGYITVGAMVAASDGLKSFIASGMPKGAGCVLANIPSGLRRMKGSGLLIPLSAKALAEVKAVPTIASGVIEPTRLADYVRSEEQQKITLRDVLDVGTMTTDSVKYIRQAYSRAAANVAAGAQKPEATLAFEPLTTTAKKTAVWIPVQDEQLADFSELARIIDNELLWDVDKAQEEGIAYGDGTGEEFDGIFNDPDIPDARFVSGDTLIDTVRRAMTDIRIAGYEANAVLMDPMDWETVVLEKGSDLRYVWIVVTDGNVQRLHGIQVVESTAVRDFQGNETDARNLLVGDFRRGATLWDREQSSVQVGWINDQFIRNMRTILAERRAAFAVRRPLAFVKYETQAAVVS